MSDKTKKETKEVKVYDTFAEEVWDVLSRIDVSTHVGYLEATAKRPAIDYLPWHRAWMLLKRKFPASTFAYERDIVHPDGTVEVGVWVSIRKTQNEAQESYSRLAVMDNWMNPVSNPSARAINDSRQRVLVKALAFAGLGLNLWGHDSMPVGKLEDPITDSEYTLLKTLIEKSDTNEESFLKWCECETLIDLPSERFQSAKGLLEAKIKRQQRAKK
jgi:hypothetical protein